jgi:hypothetical protein
VKIKGCMAAGEIALVCDERSRAQALIVVHAARATTPAFVLISAMAQAPSSRTTCLKVAGFAKWFRAAKS